MDVQNVIEIKKIVISNMINYMYNLGDGNYVNSSIK